MPYTYIVASRKHGAIYTGVTSDLHKRMLEHKTKHYDGYTARYSIDRLVWYQECQDIQEAIDCEKKVKGRVRKRKVELIEEENREWRDLFEGGL